jgi:hypothetical protein
MSMKPGLHHWFLPHHPTNTKPDHSHTLKLDSPHKWGIDMLLPHHLHHHNFEFDNQ